MSDPIRQHHVPQLYLRKFAKKEKKIYKTNVLRKGQKKSFKANIEDIAVEKHFYTLESENDKYVWEKYYANEIEPKMKTVLNLIINRCSSSVLSKQARIINNDEKALASIVLVFQMLRSKNCREYEKKLYKDLMPEVVQNLKDNFPNSMNDKLDKKIRCIVEDENTFKAIICGISTNLERIDKFASFLYNRTWIFFQLNDEKEFITSDNPVMFLNSRTLEATPFQNGLLDNDTVVSFPVSPKILLVMYSENKYFGIMNSWDCQKRVLSGKKDDRFIDLQNKLQFEQCNQFVISKKESVLNKL